MATTTNKNQSQSSNNEQHGKQGFASMPKEKVQEIASKGGKASGHSHSESHQDKSSGSRGHNKNYQGSENHEHGKQGFASMPKEKV
ncbi:KGG domain-containing protein [Candidatus Paracaedibacter symbiosus]|uniref:KGG domain-containing protein n=1 Tax=Candidatus Paracaedibacter symbiosus TaxID=244582 RepID=UPI00050968CA|nr:KGG domain-containing protein [Candidatus Paracaedibacter symbiosus]